MTSNEIQRKLTAILCTDVVGYSRLMGADEAATLHILTKYRQIFSNYIEKFNGRVVNAPGDSILAEFPSVVDAVECAVEIQQELAQRNNELPDDQRMDFRIGINLGDVMVQGDELYGDGVNIAARLESLADPGGICISQHVFYQVKQKLPVVFEDMGDQHVKNISEPVRAYKALLKGHEGTRATTANERKKESPVVPEKPSVAVLPFKNMSADPGHEYFCDGISEDIITDLSKLSQLIVISRHSSFTFKGQKVDLHHVGKELGAQYILEGSVRNAGGRVRITAQLIVAASGSQIWAERYDRTLEDIFDVQDDITQEIITALDVNLVGGEQMRTWRNSLKHPASRDLFYKGRELFHEGTKASIGQALKLFEKLTQSEPDSSLGYVWMAWVGWWILFRGWSENPEETALSIGKNVKKAQNLGDTSAEIYGVSGNLSIMQGDYAGAVASARQAMVLSTNGADAASLAAFIFLMAGENSEAIQAAEHALRLSPVGQPISYNILGVALREAGRLDEAITVLKKATAMAPYFSTARFALISVYIYAERDDDARAEADILQRQDPSFSLTAYTQRLPFRDKAINERLEKELRRVGLI